MPFTQKFRDQLLTVQDQAVGFLVKEFDSLFASLAFLSPLADNWKLPTVKNGTIFTTSAGLPSVHQQVRCCAYSGALQTLTTATVTTITFDSELFDIGGMHDPSTFTSRLTVPTGGDGLYLVSAICPFASNAVGQRQLRITKNGQNTTETTPYCILPAGIVGFVMTLEHTLLIPMIAGDYVEMDAYQDSGGNLNAGDGGTSRTQLTAIKIAAA